jgi:hypothetical protein
MDNLLRELRDTMPNRLDTQTKISLMTAFMFGAPGADTIKDAVNLAFEIDEAVKYRLKEFKTEHQKQKGLVRAA